MIKLTIEDALKSANDICRSAFAIAERSGKRTNWKAFLNKVKGSLHLQHKVMVESGMFDQRNMAATIPQKIETELDSLRTELAKKDEEYTNACHSWHETEKKVFALKERIKELERKYILLRSAVNGDTTWVDSVERAEAAEAKVKELEEQLEAAKSFHEDADWKGRLV